MQIQRITKIILTALLFLIASALGHADSLADRLADRYLTATPAEAPKTEPNQTEAYRIQENFVTRLQTPLGKIIGYKAALTSRPAQEKFGVGQPVMGILLEEMLLPSGSSIRADAGVRLMAEADLLVRVGNAAINSANSHHGLLASLSEVIPFMEIPDLMYEAGEKLDGPALIAINAGARFGVMGTPVALTLTPEWEQRLADFHVTLQDSEGNVLTEGKGSNLMGHPLEVVRWIRDELKKRGHKLNPGDLISLGSLTRLIPVAPGMKLTARYNGLHHEKSQAVEIQID